MTWFERPESPEEAETDSGLTETEALTENSMQPENGDPFSTETSTAAAEPELPMPLNAASASYAGDDAMASTSDSESAATDFSRPEDRSEQAAIMAEPSEAADESSSESESESSPPRAPDSQEASAAVDTASTVKGEDVDVEMESSGEDEAGLTVDDFEAQLEAAERAERARGELVGTVELSFSQSTRTPSMTLNPPPVSPIARPKCGTGHMIERMYERCVVMQACHKASPVCNAMVWQGGIHTRSEA